MEDGVFPSSTMLTAPSDSAMDFDYMDELFLDGCWLETTDGSEFLNPNPFPSPTLFDPPFVWETSNGIWSTSPSTVCNQDERQLSMVPGDSRLNETQGIIPSVPPSFSHNIVNGSPPGSYKDDVSQLGRRWWIGPSANTGPSVRERLFHALEYIKEFTRDKDVLIQLWVPVNRGGRRVLVTNDQPFRLDNNCLRLANYREISVDYEFSAEDDSKDVVGLPGRVFLGKVPEWTPDVRFFRSEEYPRLNHAQKFDVRGTLALPVFEQASKTCLGVIEVVMTTQMVNYPPELESVSKALEAVNLRSSEIPTIRNIKACDNSYQAALPEIQEVVRSACQTHRLPLVQTWVACAQQGKGGSRHSNENYLHCVSTVADACYVADPSIRGFHEACSEHHLLKGEGVAGAAFNTNQPCFSADITNFKKTEYPLAHHATIFGLCGAVAIRLRCIHTGTADFVLEFFLPVDCRHPEDQRKMLSSLSIIIQQVCQSLRVVTDKELEGDVISQSSELIISSHDKSRRQKVDQTRPEKYSRGNSARTPHFTKVQQGNNAEEMLDIGEHQEEFSLNTSFECGEDSSFIESSFSSAGMVKFGEKRRAKAEKTITLQVLQQYFAGSLKNAAKSIGVCPTTLKRICRQHGIKRWPSRKIKKVGHSLEKIQRVIDSVQGVSGAIKIGSFYSNFPELASSPKVSGTTAFSTCPKPSSIIHPERHHAFRPPQVATATNSLSSSCSQNSSSSQCCSNGTQQQQPFIINATGGEDSTVVIEGLTNSLLKKRVRSVTELGGSGQEKPKLLPRCRREYPVSNNVPLVTNQEVVSQRVKVTYGDENIRFRMHNNWRFIDLSREIARRFNIDGMNRFDLKYLDDDSEWVLLTCDADLEECIDVCQSSKSDTIRILLQVSHIFQERSSDSSSPS